MKRAAGAKTPFISQAKPTTPPVLIIIFVIWSTEFKFIGILNYSIIVFIRRQYDPYLWGIQTSTIPMIPACPVTQCDSEHLLIPQSARPGVTPQLHCPVVKKEPVLVYLQAVDQWWIKEDMGGEREEFAPHRLTSWGYRDEALKAEIPFFPVSQSSSQSCLRGDRCSGNTVLIYAAAYGAWFMSAVLWTTRRALALLPNLLTKAKQFAKSIRNADVFFRRG